jgi:hypothetical protein
MLSTLSRQGDARFMLCRVILRADDIRPCQVSRILMIAIKSWPNGNSSGLTGCFSTG